MTANGSTAVTLAAGANTFKKGDVITFVGCNRVPPDQGGYRRPAAVRGDGGLRWRCWQPELCPRPSTPLAVVRTWLPLALQTGLLGEDRRRIGHLQAVPGVPQGRIRVRHCRSGHAPRAWTSLRAKCSMASPCGSCASTTSTTTSSLAVWMCCTATRPSVLSLPAASSATKHSALQGVFFGFIHVSRVPQGLFKDGDALGEFRLVDGRSQKHRPALMAF